MTKSGRLQARYSTLKQGIYTQVTITQYAAINVLGRYETRKEQD